jgi:hypothetical protein
MLDAHVVIKAARAGTFDLGRASHPGILSTRLAILENLSDDYFIRELNKSGR